MSEGIFGHHRHEWVKKVLTSLMLYFYQQKHSLKKTHLEMKCISDPRIQPSYKYFYEFLLYS